MAVQMDRGLDRRLEGLDNGIRIIGRDEPCHILDADTVGAHGLKGLCLLDVIFQVVHFSAQTGFGHGIADTALKMFAALFDNRYHGLKIAIIVQGIKGPENIHPVSGGSFHKGPGHIIGIIAVPHQILGPKQHRERGFFHIPL